MYKFADAPCPTCSHQSTGTQHINESNDRSGMGRTYDSPPASCACECHTAWRMVNRTPPIAANAAA